MSQLKNFLLSRVSPEALKSFGIRLLIAGLFGEAIVLVLLSPSLIERLLSALFTIAIAFGVWLEEVGDNVLAETAKKPRWQVLEAKEKQVTERIKPFSGTEFDLACSSDTDREQRNFLWTLQPVLENAGWKYTQWKWEPGYEYDSNNNPLYVKDVRTDEIYGKVGVVSVVVEYAYFGEPPEKTREAADALVAALNEIGITTAAEYSDLTNSNVNAVHVTVGPK
jgi:hypothetical protein